jgi:predicted ribosome quality control (RQC) complex YloA/Tae2 family protein
MRTYTSVDGITIKVGEDAKENDILTQSSFPNEWWMHVDGGAGSHVVICCEDNVLPRETKRDAATLAVYYSKSAKTRMVRVNVVRVDQVLKHEKIKNHGQVYLEGSIDQLTILPNKEGERLKRLLK